MWRSTPNLASISYVCYATRVAVCSATATGKYGGKTWDTVAVPDFFSGPHCVVEWGSQKRTSNDHGLIGFAPVTEALRGRPVHILVDPRKPSSAGEVDLWLPVRPGSDAAMALGWINLIIEEELYDKAFVEQYCHGFEELRARAREFEGDGRQAEPLLPAAKAPLEQRAEALVEWCRGFLGGYGLAGAVANASPSSVTSDVLSDFGTIAGSSFDYDDEAEDARAFADVLEFVREATALLHRESRQRTVTLARALH